VLYAIPYMMVVIVLLALFGSRSPVSQLVLLFIALGSVSWLTMARIVRGQAISLKNQEFVLAARATGVRPSAIVARHLVPNTVGPVIVYATLTVPSMMRGVPLVPRPRRAGAAGLLGQPGGRRHPEHRRVPCQLIFPGATMALTLFALNFGGRRAARCDRSADEEAMTRFRVRICSAR
jgi:oligopeptide transport system permease protein